MIRPCIPDLADAVTAILSLFVVVGVEVDVVEDDHVGRGEVDAQTTCPSANQEDEDLGVLVVLVYQFLPGGQNVMHFC